MKPYYQREGITLYHGDCVEVLQSLKRPIDAVVTSPAYNTLGKRIPKRGTGSMFRNAWIKKVNQIGYEDSMPEPDYQAWLRNIVDLLLGKTKGIVWINHKIRYRGGEAVHPVRFLPFPLWSEVIWQRAGSIMFNARRYAQSHEGFYGFGKPHWWDNSQNKLLTVWSISQVRHRADHPCPYPIELPRRLIAASVPPGGLVLDPFAGSCTTGFAAIELGRQFVGIDSCEAYLQSAIERFEERLKHAA